MIYNGGGAEAPMTAAEADLQRRVTELEFQVKLRNDALRLLATAADRYTKQLRDRVPVSRWRDRFLVALSNARNLVPGMLISTDDE